LSCVAISSCVTFLCAGCAAATVLQKLAFSVCEVKLVPLESITAVERSIADFNRTQQDQVGQQPPSLWLSAAARAS